MVPRGFVLITTSTTSVPFYSILKAIAQGARFGCRLRGATLIGASDAFLHPFDDPLLWQGHVSNQCDA